MPRALLHNEDGMAVSVKDIDQAFVTHSNKYSGCKEDYFAAVYLSREFKLPIEEVLDQIAFGNSDYGFDAFHVDVQRRNLYLFQFKWSENHQLFKDSLKRMIKDGMERVFGNPHQDQQQNVFLVRLRNALHENQAVIDRVYIQLVFNGDQEVAEQSASLDNLREDLESKKYLIDGRFSGRDVDLSIQFLSNKTHRKPTKPVAWKTHKYDVDLSNPLHAEGSAGELLHVGYLRLMDLYRMHKEMGQRLFERNIRSGLSADRPANRELKRTLGRIVLDQKEDPRGFLFNHNGVTIAAQQLAFENGHATIVEPRVLNGAQTVTTLVRFMEENADHPALKKAGDRLEAVRVLAKVISQASDERIVGVTICNNRQNPVEPWNLRASDEIQTQLQDKFRHDVGIFYARQENAFEQLTNEDLEELGIEEAYKAIEIRRLAQTFLAVQGEIDKMSRMPDVFEDEKVYRSTFRESYLSASTRRIVLAYKIQYRLNRLIREITEKGEKKYAYLNRCRNLVWGLLVQALLNDSKLSTFEEQYGQSLAVEADFAERLKQLASTRVRFIISETLKDERSRALLNEERYSFLRTKAMFDRCMNTAYEKYKWTKRPL
jgi:hypothetical protein